VVATKTTARNAVSALGHLLLSMKHLDTNYIDLWQFHNVSTLVDYERVLGPGGAMDAAQEMLEAGKIHHIGLSTHSMDVALKAVSSGYFETILFPFIIISNEASDKLVSFAKEHDVGFLAMKSFAGSILDDAALAIKYLLQFDNVVPVPGIEKVNDIEEIYIDMSPRLCRQCEICLPCPKGVFIPGVMYLRILHRLWPEEWFLSWSYVAKSVESSRNCNQCGDCEWKCPHHLPIREIIAENLRFYESIA